MLKNISNHIFLTVVFVLTNYITIAQQVYIETGFENAYFKDYINNLGNNTLDLSYSKAQEVFIESGFRFKLYEERFTWDIGAGYNKYKINTGFYAGNISIPTTYNLSYVTLKAGVNFAIVNERRLKVQIHTHASHDWLIEGKRKYKDNTVNLYKENTFDKTLLRFHRGISVEYVIHDNLSTYIKYNVADSFKDKNKDSNTEEKYSFHTKAFSFGLLFYILRLNNRRF
ncbi:hypothetical protein [Polaribacter atrinae]|uniref:Outer membrane protein beta-barrel domain-containing protein n=1 Tax=Polaribacter atrinae TaxID=1333662 RepID=A0A176TBN7_9FLAO|nr:hypothetical protein [Polaribacter atrinae]OAD45081.1 hypothetical protein LPB303_09085 [Polaribacter atrinae]